MEKLRVHGAEDVYELETLEIVNL